jgi:uncharacterized RDD family membrane protein YckC
MNTELNAIYCNRCGSKSARDAQFCQSCGESFRTTVATSAPQLAAQPSHANASSSAPTLTVRYAGFWIRVVASLIDLCVVFVGFLPVRMLLGSTATLLGVSWQIPTARIFFIGRMVRIGFAVLLGWLYRAGMESSRFQGTLGKLAVQIRVTDLDGNRISFEQATGRYLAKFLSVITLGVGYLMAGFTPRKQGLHDQLAGTLVQYR